MVPTLFLAFLVQVTLVASWDYADTASWPVDYPTCGGSRQSPIDIVTADLTPRNLLPLTPLYCPLHDAGTVLVTNTAKGNSFKFYFADLGNCDTINIGQKTYKLAQMHYHWGSDFNLGTEHSVDGTTYAAELHAVHYDTTYAGLGEAVASGEGDALAVVGYMFSESSETGLTSGFDGFFDILSKFPDIASGSNFTLNFPTSLDLMLPRSVPCYAHYEGSLTTPGCNELVQWFVASEIYAIPQNFLDYMRRQRDSQQQLITQNWRPAQPLNNRTVYTPEGCVAATGTNGDTDGQAQTDQDDAGVQVNVSVDSEDGDDHGLIVATLVLVCVGLFLGILACLFGQSKRGVSPSDGENPAFVNVRT